MENKKCQDWLKTLFIVVGAIVTVSAVVITLYSIFKKFFKISFECNTGNVYDSFGGDCNNYEPEVSFCDSEELFGADEI